MTDLTLQRSEVNLFLQRGDDVAIMLRLTLPGRFVIDGHLEVDGSTLTSEDAAFTDDDIGSVVQAFGLPDGTTILAVTDAETAELSAEATVDDNGAGVFIGTRTVVDLTGSTGNAQVRATATDEAILAEFGVEIDDGAENGWLLLTMAHAVAQALPTSNSAWDLEIIDAEGKKRTYIGGKLKTIADVTRVEVP